MARLQLQDYETIEKTTPTATPVAPAPSTSPTTPGQTSTETPTAAPIQPAQNQTPLQKLSEPIKKEFRSNYSDFGKELGAHFGVEWPDDAQWDQMSFADKAKVVPPALFSGAIKLILGFPKAVVQALPNFVVQASMPIQNLIEGKEKPFSLDTLAAQQNPSIPLLDSLPVVGKNVFTPSGNYYGPAKQTKDEVSYIARQAGVPNILADFIGKAAGAGSVVTQALGDLAISASMAETMKNALKPRATLDAKAPISTEPIPYVERNIGGKKVYTAGEADSPAQYYSLSKTFAKEKWGGSSDNTFWKLSPTYEGGVELSVVRHVDAQPGTYTKIGGVEVPVVQGKFGPEVKLHAETLKGSTPATEEPFKLQSPETPTTADVVQKQIDDLDMMEANLAETEQLIRENPVLGLKKYEAKSGEFKGQLPEALGLSLEEIRKTKSYGKIRSEDTLRFIQQGDQIADELGMTPDEAAAKYSELKDQLEGVRAAKADLKTKQAGLAEELKKAKTPDERAQMEAEYFGNTIAGPEGPSASFFKANVPTTPLKGFENKLVGLKEISNLDNLAQAVKMPSGMAEVIVRNMTGKNAAADLTQAEYVKVAQEISKFQNPYIPKTEIPNISRYLEPQRHWMSAFEEKTGQPIWSKVGRPLFEAEALQKVKVYNAENWIADIMGKYGDAESGRILRAYRLGDTAAIDQNPNLSAQAKADLKAINERITEYFTTVAGDTNINLAEFENNPARYVPDLADLGGKFTLYKSNQMVKGPEKITTAAGEEKPGSSFFAKQKKEGNLNIPVDNIWQLMDIYARAGYKAKYFDPIKSEFQNILPKLDSKIADSVNSTIQEVLGYGSNLDKFANETLQKFFNKLPGVNLPQDAFRRLMNVNSSYIYANVLNQPATWFRQFLSYPTIGYANIGSEFMAETIKDFVLHPMKYMEKARQGGFLLDMGSIAELEFRKDVTLPEKGVGLYSKFNSAPNSIADNVTRAMLAEQADRIFDNSLARFQQKKITWDQLTKDTHLSGMSVPDQNLIIGRINSGDLEGAKNLYIRNMIDDTFWPYQKGSSGRITYGTIGKTGSMLLKWPLEYATTLKTWIARGQWDKVIRLYASSAAINRTFRDAFGWDFSTSMFLGPVLGLGLPPIQKMAASTVAAFQALLNGDAQALTENKDELVTTLKNVYRPLGLEGQNVQAFFKSWNQGPREDGKYLLYSRAGNPQYYVDFGTIWNQLFGMPSTERVDKQNFINKEKTLNFLGDRAKSDVRQEIYKLIREGKTEELNELVKNAMENKIDIGEITASDVQKSMLPIDQSLFKQLSPEARQILFPEFMRLNQ